MPSTFAVKPIESIVPPVRPERAPRLRIAGCVPASTGVTVCLPMTEPISRMSARHCVPGSSCTRPTSLVVSRLPPATLPMIAEQHAVTLSFELGWPAFVVPAVGAALPRPSSTCQFVKA